jgi:predicted histone-like DNA-binding protein
MAKYFMREMYDMNGVGERLAYPQIVEFGQILEDEFVRRVGEEGIGLNQSVVESALAGISEKLAQLMGLGYSVKVRGLGTFAISLGMEQGKDYEKIGADDSEDGPRNAQSIKVKRVRFKADKKLMRRATHWCNLERDGERYIRRLCTSEEERRLKAIEFIGKNLFMKVADYMRLTGMSKTMAAKELRRFRQDPASGITVKGHGTHIIYVKSGI